MFVQMIESTFFMSANFLTLGTGVSLQLAHEESFKAIFLGSFALWTGFWIGTNLNAQLLKYLFRDKVQVFVGKYNILQCMDKAAENHGSKIIFFLRFCPVSALNLLIQLIALTGVSYKNFVKGGISSIVPIIFKVIQGTQISSIDELDAENYETLQAYDLYN